MRDLIIKIHRVLHLKQYATKFLIFNGEIFHIILLYEIGTWEHLNPLYNMCVKSI